MNFIGNVLALLLIVAAGVFGIVGFPEAMTGDIVKKGMYVFAVVGLIGTALVEMHD